MKKVSIFCSVVFFSFNFIQSGFSQVAGTYDSTFATDGELSDASLYPFTYSAMALVPGNEFVISRMSRTRDTLIVLRFLTSGERDVTFGPLSTGITQIVMPFNDTAIVTSSAVQSDRKTLIAGQTATSSISSQGFLLRLNDDGSIDSTFGNNGFVYQQMFPASGDKFTQVAVQPDGNILVLDAALITDSTDTLALLRFTPAGSADNTFNGSGAYNIPFYNFLPTGPFFFNIDANDNINFAAYSNFGDTDNLYMFQLTPSGTLNTSFGQGGVTFPAGTALITSPGLIDHGYNIGLNFDASDKLLLTQSSLIDSIQWIVERFNTDGTPDLSFGDSGVVDMQGADGAVPYSIQNIAPTPFSQIVIAGLVSIAGGTRIDVARLNANGTIDGAFGDYVGHALLNSAELDDFIWNLIIQPDEKILINGLVTENKRGGVPPFTKYEVVRLNGTGNGVAPSAISDLGSAAQVSVYPNPTANSLFVDITGTDNGILELKDAEGRLCLHQQTKPGILSQLDLENLSAGIYLLTFKANNALVTTKVIKQ